MIRKNISLRDEDMKKIEGLLKKHEGNLSAAMREMIDFIDFVQRKFGSIEEAKKVERKVKGIYIPNTLMTWFLTYTDECLPDEAATGCIEEISAIKSMSDLADVADFGLPVATKIDANDERNPSEVTIQASGERIQREFVAKIISCFLANNYGMVVEEVQRGAMSTIVALKKTVEIKEEKSGSYKKVRESLLKHFGDRHVMLQEILDKPKFWNSMINATTEWSSVQKYKYPGLYS